ncbi:MAG: DUF4325 domain-containing protein [Chloroflexi bacterium]|nr:DUF4325 domain-containing protein [Chloroflexota bacterium]
MAYLSESPDNRVVIDFSGVRTLGTGFADEAFGRLFLRLGAATFLSQLTFSNATRTVAASIDRAITMRVDSGASPEQFNNKVDS